MKLKYNDKVHGYWLDGKRCKSVTGVAKIPDDDFNLVRWKARQIALGLARSPHLIESVAAHHTDNNKLDELCEQALSASGSDQAAEWGTAVHRVTERIDAAEPIMETPLSLSIAERWTGLLDKAGLEIVPELAERVVIYPEHRLCGKFDRIFRRVSDGRLVVGDLKTGASSVRYPHSVATQLALYANAPLLAGRWEGLDGSTDKFTALPDELDRSVGYIIFMPPAVEHDAVDTVFSIDLALGWKACEEIIFRTLRWRAVKNEALLKPVVTLP